MEGRNCESCILSVFDGAEKHCAALSDKPICAKKECRKDCQLIENTKELPIIDIADLQYQKVMSYGDYLLIIYTRNAYRDSIKTKSK